MQPEVKHRANTIKHLIISHLHNDFYIDLDSLGKVLLEKYPDINLDALKNEVSKLVHDGYLSRRKAFNGDISVLGKKHLRTKFEYALGEKPFPVPRLENTRWADIIDAEKSKRPGASKE